MARKPGFRGPGTYEQLTLASPPGLEPGTYCLEGSCSILLSYRDTQSGSEPICDGSAVRPHFSTHSRTRATETACGTMTRL